RSVVIYTWIRANKPSQSHLHQLLHLTELSVPPVFSFRTFLCNFPPIRVSGGRVTMGMIRIGATRKKQSPVLVVGILVLALFLEAADAEYRRYRDPTKPMGGRIRDLMGRMTLQEKIGQMVQIDRKVASADVVKNYFIGSILSGGGSVPGQKASPEEWIKMVNEYQSGAMSTRLGIPLIYGIDAVHGHNNVYNATIFPHNIGLGATREPALVKKIGAATALEMRATGIPYAFAPCIAVCRDPRWGRCYESYSEDSEIVKAMTELIPGLQGDVPADARKGVPYVAGKRKVAACAKHFVGDGGTVKGINENNTIIDWNGLRRIHMPAYFASIVKGVSTVMVSYSSWNGVRMHANRNLVTSYLKDTLKFRGFVISDWQGIDRLTDPPHANYTYSVEKAVAAGLDMVMVPLNYTEFIDDLTLLVNKGVIPMSRIDDAVRRILRVKFVLGLFDNPMADDSMVNELGKQWSTTKVTYEEAPTADYVKANDFSYAIVVVGEHPYVETGGDNLNLTIPDPGPATIRNVCGSVKCVVVLISGRPLVIEPYVDSMDGLVAAWLPGTEGPRCRSKEMVAALERGVGGLRIWDPGLFVCAEVCLEMRSDTGFRCKNRTKNESERATFQGPHPSGRKIERLAGVIALVQEFYHDEHQLRVDMFETLGSATDLPEAPLHPNLNTLRKSYADVVRGGGFYGVGSCSIVQDSSGIFIRVGQEGVSERSGTLERCLVIRFQSVGHEVFSRDQLSGFRRWAEKTWASDSNFGLEELDDGRWLLICPSLRELMRINSLAGHQFKNFLVSTYLWKEIDEGAPRLDDACWMLVFGIPLHLKSVNLIRTIGEFCGNLLDIDWNSWASSCVRMKVIAKGSTSSSIPLVYEDQWFTVDVKVLPASLSGGRRESEQGKRGEKSKGHEDFRVSQSTGSSQSQFVSRVSMRNLKRRTLRAGRPSLEGSSSMHGGVQGGSNTIRVGDLSGRVKKVWVRKFGPLLRPTPPESVDRFVEPASISAGPGLIIYSNGSASGPMPGRIFSALFSKMMQPFSGISVVFHCPSPGVIQIYFEEDSSPSSRVEMLEGSQGAAEGSPPESLRNVAESLSPLQSDREVGSPLILISPPRLVLLIVSLGFGVKMFFPLIWALWSP
ncbi:unnamed protein product, partial [Linum tenue]